MSLDELVDLMFEDLELPDIERKRLRQVEIERLFRLDKNDVGTSKCPCCSADHPKYWREEECLAHMEAEHKVAME